MSSPLDYHLPYPKEDLNIVLLFATFDKKNDMNHVRLYL